MHMDSLFLLQFACFIFMLLNAAIVAVSHLHVNGRASVMSVHAG